MKRKEAPWNDYKTQFVAVAAVRYCYGRASYAPSLVCEWVRQYWPHLDAKTRANLIRDTHEALDDANRAGEPLGKNAGPMIGRNREGLTAVLLLLRMHIGRK